jgi:hypothetical protein
MSEEPTNSQEISTMEWQEQQDQIGQWVAQLVERLKVDKVSVTKALLDWVVVNGENDWLKEAAESDAAMGDYGSGDLSEFLRLATVAWQAAWGKEQQQSLDDVLEQIEDLIQSYRERNTAD